MRYARLLLLLTITGPVLVRTQPRVERLQAAGASVMRTSAQEGDSEKEMAIRQLMKISGAANLGDQMMGPITQQIRTMMASAIPQADREKFMDDFSDRFRARFRGEDIVNAIVPIYARHFSIEDIRELTQFYESPLGKRFVAALPQISKESQAVGTQLGQKAVLDTLREMSDEYPDLKKLLQSANSPAKGGAGSGASPAPVSGANSK